MMADDGTRIEIGFVPTPETTRDLRGAFGQFATGVTIVTIQGPDGPMGFTANSFSSLSLDPALMLWSLAKSARRFPYFAAAKHFAVHILAADQDHLIDRFHRSGAGFAGLEHQLGPQGVPLIAGALARFECEQHATHEGGDHLIVVGRVLRVLCQDGAPLVFSGGRRRHISAED
jgi:flavin reductase (DIM6/NTAB) family NADH-FMN oxidoreductase RutF